MAELTRDEKEFLERVYRELKPKMTFIEFMNLYLYAKKLAEEMGYPDPTTLAKDLMYEIDPELSYRENQKMIEEKIYAKPYQQSDIIREMAEELAKKMVEERLKELEEKIKELEAKEKKQEEKKEEIPIIPEEVEPVESETPEEVYHRYLNLFRKMISGIQLTPEETKELARYTRIFNIYNIPHIEYQGKALYLEPVAVYPIKGQLIDIKDLKFYTNPLTGDLYRIDMRSGKLKPTNKINLMRAVIEKLKLEKKMEREAEELERELKEEEEHKKKRELAFAGLEREEEKKPKIINFNEIQERRQGTQPTPSGMEELAKLLDRLAYRITGEPLLESELDYEEEVLEEAQRRFNKLMRYIANKIQPFQLKEIMEQHKNDYNLVWFYWLLKEIFLSRTGLNMDKVRIVDVEGQNTWRKIISSAKRKFWEKIVNDSETGDQVLMAVDQLCREFGM